MNIKYPLIQSLGILMVLFHSISLPLEELTQLRIAITSTFPNLYTTYIPDYYENYPILNPNNFFDNPENLFLYKNTNFAKNKEKALQSIKFDTNNPNNQNRLSKEDTTIVQQLSKNESKDFALLCINLQLHIQEDIKSRTDDTKKNVAFALIELITYTQKKYIEKQETSAKAQETENVIKKMDLIKNAVTKIEQLNEANEEILNKLFDYISIEASQKENADETDDDDDNIQQPNDDDEFSDIEETAPKTTPELKQITQFGQSLQQIAML